MPPRSNRNGRNKDTQPSDSHSHSQPLSPPTQLPTPLPDESLTSSPAQQAQTLRQDDSLSRLINIDYDTPTDDFRAAHADFYAAHDLGNAAYMHDSDSDEAQGAEREEEVVEGRIEPLTYRSPPFREAQLAESLTSLALARHGEAEAEQRDESAPLPIPPPRTATATAMPAPMRPMHFQPPRSPSQASSASAAASPPRHTQALSPRTRKEYDFMPTQSPPYFPPSSTSPHSTFPPQQGTRQAENNIPPALSWLPRPVSDLPGHVIAPVLQRPSSTLHRVTRMAPSKPLLSTPLSFGTFTSRGGESGAIGEGQYMEYGAIGGMGIPRSRGRGTCKGSGPGKRGLAPGSRLPLGLGIWDCTNLKQVTEILNINHFDGVLGSTSGARHARLRAAHAAVLPPPDARSLRAAGLKEDPMAGDRPLVGILLESEARDSSTFLIYSLRRNASVKTVPLPGRADTFMPDATCIVISTTHPPTLYIFTSTTFDIVYSIDSSSLLPFTHSTSSNKSPNELSISTLTNTFNNINNPVSVVPGLDLDGSHTSPPAEPAPTPIFSLKGRFLAYASAAASTPASDSSLHGAANRSPTFTLPLGQGITLTQSDIGNAAWKVGGSMLSGMKTLGGMALDAAKNKLAGEIPQLLLVVPQDPGAYYTPGTKERRYSNASAVPHDACLVNSEQDHDQPKTLAPHTTTRPDDGFHVTVLDLGPLLSGAAAAPRKISTFKAALKSRVSFLRFSADGCQLAVIPEHGHDCRVYALRPTPVLRAEREVEGADARDIAGDKGSALSAARTKNEAAWRLYTLHRGVSPAAVEAVDWTDDGRWVAIGSNHRTIHMFAVNPYGGSPDVRSHIEGRVKNSDVLQPFGTDVSRAVKIHIKNPSDGGGHGRVPLAFTFISSSDATYPTHVTSTPDLSNSPPLSRRSGCQDVLVFDPVPGKLSLYRVTVTERTRDQGLSLSGPLSSLGRPSISLPGVGGGGQLGVSPSTSRAAPSTPTAAALTELSCEAQVAAFWHVRRQRNWTEVAYPWSVVSPYAQGSLPSPPGNFSDVNWLAEAELWTHSRSDKVLPRSIYASHRFMFYTLGEDYHALMRRWHFNITGQRIEVRKEVEVSAHGIGVGENFVSNFSPMHSTFIENPLASALEAELQYTNPHAILPMYPNGSLGSKPRSFSNSIPIRATVAGIGDGVTEGIGRFRRKVRSPQFRARSDESSPSVPLEFEEDDAHFPYYDALDIPRSKGDDSSAYRAGGSADSAPSIAISTPSTAPREEGLVEMAEDDLDYGWEKQDQQAIDDAERFDDISVVGFLDEEQASMRQAVQNKVKRRKKK
ncbi:hypothetical protein BDQ17DRAFT_1433964 [Cyathus striatus]|nr:hypothetical protein BDQ17DRAFT_1433964 [Cyathus striatus]